jgi:hypothetical protein
MNVDLNAYITPNNYFKWSEALYLPSLKTYHDPSPEEIKNIIETCQRLDLFRQFIGKPFVVNCWLRPTKVNDINKKYNGVNYNKLPTINGATQSAHIYGLAVDFFVKGMTVDKAMELIGPKCPEFKMSAENNGTKTKRNWLHLQARPMRDGTYRVFDL